MEQRPFGKTGLTVAPVGFGAAPIGFLRTEQKQVASVLDLLLDHGVNLIDTAAIYEGSEEAIGRAVASRRDEYILVSKCGQEFPDVAGAAWSAEVIANTIDRSLKRLRTDRLDVVLLHSCDLTTLQRGEAISALVRARERGKIRFAGYSGDNEAAALAAEHNQIAVIETSVSICDQANIDLVLPAALQRGVGVIAKRPLANAAWREPSAQPGMYAEYASEYTARFQAMKISPADLGFQGLPQQLWPEIALRFTLSIHGVHTAIIGTTDAGHAKSNLQMAAKGPLPAGAVEALRAAFRRGEAAAGRPWRGET
jgi:aryl-alcohol dehydrogenase-like predicted oxidoreductase